MFDRYARQVLFYGIGKEGQKTLMEKTAVLVGCGALGVHIRKSSSRQERDKASKDYRP